MIENYKIGLRTKCICIKIEENSRLLIWTQEYKVGEIYKCEYVEVADDPWILKHVPYPEVRVYGRSMCQEHPCYFQENNFYKYFITLEEYRNNKINEILND